MVCGVSPLMIQKMALDSKLWDHATGAAGANGERFCKYDDVTICDATVNAPKISQPPGPAL